MVRLIEGLIVTFMATLRRWLQGKLSKHMLELNRSLLANTRRGWKLKGMAGTMQGLITTFMATWVDLIKLLILIT